MSFLKRFLMLFFVILLFVFFSQSYLFCNQEQATLEKELSNAKSKSSTGLILAIAGVVVFTGSAVLTFADQKEVVEIGWDYLSYDKKVKGIYIVGDILGLVTGAVGLTIHLSAKRNVKKLEKEKGLTTRVTLGVLPKYKARGIKITISF